MTKYEKRAVDLFYEGYNCSQATFMAFSDLVDIEFDEMAKMSSSFGGGMGKMGEVCGALTGAFMTIGAILGYDDPKDKEKKEKHYELIQQISKDFKVEKGSILCRNLLEFNKEITNTASRPPYKECEHYVLYAVKLVEDVLAKQSIT